VVEVEDFILGRGVGSHFDEPASHILLAVDGDQVVGAVVQGPGDGREALPHRSHVAVLGFLTAETR
jgi:hypothetical protein